MQIYSPSKSTRKAFDMTETLFGKTTEKVLYLIYIRSLTCK